MKRNREEPLQLFNASGQPDPTPAQAVLNIIEQEQRRELEEAGKIYRLCAYLKEPDELRNVLDCMDKGFAILRVSKPHKAEQGAYWRVYVDVAATPDWSDRPVQGLDICESMI